MSATQKTPKPINPHLIRAGGRLHTLLYKLTGGLLGTVSTFPTLLLTTTGRKSGQPRTTPLLYLADGDRWIVVASFGGSPTHPVWWLNLQADPDAAIQIRGRRTAVRAREAKGEERKQLWPKLVDLYGGFDQYRKATDREFPVVILEPR